jgi:hypothetical protein
MQNPAPATRWGATEIALMWQTALREHACPGAPLPVIQELKLVPHVLGDRRPAPAALSCGLLLSQAPSPPLRMCILGVEAVYSRPSPSARKRWALFPCGYTSFRFDTFPGALEAPEATGGGEQSKSVVLTRPRHPLSFASPAHAARRIHSDYRARPRLRRRSPEPGAQAQG